MLQKITDKWNTGEQMEKLVKEAEELVERYGWQDRITHPYENCPTKVSKILADCKDYYECTKGTREYLVQLINGLVPILNSWEQYELAPKVAIRVVGTDKVIEVLAEDAEFFLEHMGERYRIAE